MDKTTARQVIDGLMLGELLFGEIYLRVVRREHPVSFELRYASLYQAADAFRALDVEIRNGYPKIEPDAGRDLKGDVVRGYMLETEAYRH